MIASDRAYVRALGRLLELQERHAGVLELGRAARAVRDAERAVLASGEDHDYLHHLASVAEGGPVFFVSRARKSA